MCVSGRVSFAFIHNKEFFFVLPLASYGPSLVTDGCYQVRLQHLAGKVKLPSEFISHSASNCSKPNRSLTSKSSTLSTKWKTPCCVPSRSRTSSTRSPTTHSPHHQPGYRYRTTVPTSES